MLDRILQFDGNYIQKLQNYFSAMNKQLWTGSAKDGAVLKLPELANYNIIAVQFELGNRWLLVERQAGTNYFNGSTVMVYPTWVVLQDVVLNSTSEGVDYKLSTTHNDIQTSGLQPESRKYGIKAIVGVMPTPEKFGLGGVLRSILNTLSPTRKEMVLC